MYGVSIDQPVRCPCRCPHFLSHAPCTPLSRSPRSPRISPHLIAPSPPLPSPPSLFPTTGDHFAHITNKSHNVEHADYDGATQNIELASLPFAASVFEEMKAICKTLFNELSKDRKKFFTLENCFELFGLDFMVDAHEDKVRHFSPLISILSFICTRILFDSQRFIYRGRLDDGVDVEMDARMCEPLECDSLPELMVSTWCQRGVDVVLTWC